MPNAFLLPFLFQKADQPFGDFAEIARLNAATARIPWLSESLIAEHAGTVGHGLCQLSLFPRNVDFLWRSVLALPLTLAL
eukprot:11200022-Lingulodinium_polyedra.AAC.1